MKHAAILAAILTLALTPTATATSTFDTSPDPGDYTIGNDGGEITLTDLLGGITDDDLEESPCRYVHCPGGSSPDEEIEEGTDHTCGIVCIRPRPGTVDRWVLDSPQLPPAEYGYPTTSDTPPNETFVTDYSPVVEHPYEVLQCPGADTPEYDPNNEECW